MSIPRHKVTIEITYCKECPHCYMSFNKVEYGVPVDPKFSCLRAHKEIEDPYKDNYIPEYCPL